MSIRHFLSSLIALSLFGAGSSLSWAGNSRRNVEIQWDAVPDATLYEVQVIRKDEKGNKPLRFKVHEPRWSATIKPGMYSMQLRSYDDRDAPGDWSPPSDLKVRLPSVEQTSPKGNSQISAKEENSEEVRLRWEPVPGAKKYHVVVKSSVSAWQVEKDVEDTNWDVKTPVGESFAWNVTAIDEKNEMGEPNEVASTFILKGPPIQKPVVNKPLSKFVSEITWNPPSKAQAYSYILSRWNPTRRQWEKIDAKDNYKDHKVKLDISRPSGHYKIKVIAKADRRDPSDGVTMSFTTRGGFRDPAALERESTRDSLNKPTNFYAIASYLLTQIQYNSQNYDSNSIPTFKAVGGTGRVGGGYSNSESNWGGFGIVDMSGFAIQSQNFTFASMEAHLTRKLELGQAGLLLAGTGLFYKELPILTGSEVKGLKGVGKVNNIGPHAGFTYWVPFTDRLGLQGNARVYYSMLGTSTSGQKVESAMSFQYGLMGSYRLSPMWMGYAGYAFRHDESKYDAKTGDPNGYGQAGEVNTIDIDGHYLNLLLEFSF